MGMGRRVAQTSMPVAAPSSLASARSREREITDLKEMAGELRRQLAEVIDRLDRLEEGS
jgi:hypothetical protein